MRLQLPQLRGRREARALRRKLDSSYVKHPERLRAGNRVTPLRGGSEAYPAMLAAIRAARVRVHLEVYILRADRTGDEFKAALIERAQAGVQVRLLYDAVGSFSLASDYLEQLAAAGVEIFAFHPVAPWRPRRGLNTRDHQKILIIDDALGFTGGINIGDEYRPVEEQGGGWHDMHAKVEGPAVYDLAHAFRKTWVRAGGAAFPEPRLPARVEGAPEQLADVQVVSNVYLRSRWRMRQAYLHAFHRSEHRISIMNAYFIPDRGLRRAMRNAIRRGVVINVIVPSISDVRAVYYASRHLYSRLLHSGVRIFEWPEHMMHAKLGVIDDVWSTIGSHNIDRRSLQHNLEASLLIIQRPLAVALREQFDLDLRSCPEVIAAEWAKRSSFQKLLEWLCFQFRYWL